MATTIVYESRYGTTKEIAETIARDLDGDIEIARPGSVSAERLANSDTIIIGSPIYAGSGSKKIVNFCQRHRSLLLERRIGLFISCMYRDEKAEQQIAEAFPAWLISHAEHTDWLGGRVTVAGLRFLDRIIAVRFAGVKEDLDEIHPERIAEFAAKFGA